MRGSKLDEVAREATHGNFGCAYLRQDLECPWGCQPPTKPEMALRPYHDDPDRLELLAREALRWPASAASRVREDDEARATCEICRDHGKANCVDHWDKPGDYSAPPEWEPLSI